MFNLAKIQQASIIALQLGLLTAIWWLGACIQHWLNLPVSGGVIGLLLVLVALLSGVMKLDWIKAGSSFILGELVLLFIPCVVGIMKYKDLFISQGWQLVLSVVIGTIIVMTITALTVAWGFKMEAAWTNKRSTLKTQPQQGK